MGSHEVLVSEIAKFEEVPAHVNVEIAPELHRSPADLAAALDSRAALIVRNQTQVTRQLLAACDGLRVVGRLGAGLDNIDIGAAEEFGVSVVYAPEANTAAMVEYCLGQIINALRELPEAMSSTVEGGWDRARFTGLELGEATIGIIGYGRSGRSLAEKLRSLGASVTVCSRTAENVPPDIRAASLGDLLAKSDVVSLHVPGGQATRHLIGSDELAFLRPTAVLLNASRGDVVDERALLEALDAGRLRGAILDVREKEPPDVGALEATGRLHVTPHIAAFTQAAQKRVSATVLRDVVAVLEGDPPRYPAFAP